MEGASKDNGVVENSNFQRFRWLFLRKLEMRPALLPVYSDTQSVVAFSVISKCMTLNDHEWLVFRVKFFFMPVCLVVCLFVWIPTVRLSKIIA